jgi:hypothetical protein
VPYSLLQDEAMRPPFADAMTLQVRVADAPLALWRLVAGAPPLALNAAARRLIAPGRAVAPASLLALLDAAPGRRLVVTDSGPGVAPGLESRIFTPFFTTREGGSGVGLAVVRQLVHGLGGTVRHARRPGAGACFVLTF